MLERVTYHIGLPKTGTTALQKHYFSNLKGNIKYIGPTIPQNTVVKNLIDFIRGGKECDIKNDKEIKNIIRNYKNLLISAEQISNSWLAVNSLRSSEKTNNPFEPYEMKRIASRLKSFHEEYFGERVEMDVIVGFRSFPEFIKSLYAQSSTFRLHYQTNNFDRFLTYISSKKNNYSLNKIESLLKENYKNIVTYQQEELTRSTSMLDDYFLGIGIKPSMEPLPTENIRSAGGGKKYKTRNIPRATKLTSCFWAITPKPIKKLTRKLFLSKLYKLIFDRTIIITEQQQIKLENMTEFERY